MRKFVAAAAVAALAGAAFAAEDMSEFFPKPQEIAGWAISSDIQTYPGEKIYDFIDGAGEVFMKYNFETAAAAEYKGPNDAAVTVEVYRMKTPEDAYGVFSYYRPEKAEALNVQQAGFSSGIIAGVWRNTYYVKIQGLEDKPGLGDAVKEFATFVAGKIPGEGNLPQLFKVLEVDGFVRGSVRFAHSNLALKNMHFVSDEDVLGLDQGAVLVFGDYALKKRSFKAFAVIFPDEKAAQEAATKYAKFLGSAKDAEATWFKQSSRAIVGAWTGLKVGQTQDAEDVMYETMQRILDQIKTYQLHK